MFERFTDRARRAVVLAQGEARQLDHSHIGTGHILLGMIREGEGVASKVLATHNVTLERARDSLLEIVVSGTPAPSRYVPFDAMAKKDLELSRREALQLGHSHIGTEHLLLAMLQDNRDETHAQRVLISLGLDLGELRRAVFSVLDTSPTGPASDPVRATGQSGPPSIPLDESEARAFIEAYDRNQQHAPFAPDHFVSIMAEIIRGRLAR